MRVCRLHVVVPIVLLVFSGVLSTEVRAEPTEVPGPEVVAEDTERPPGEGEAEPSATFRGEVTVTSSKTPQTQEAVTQLVRIIDERAIAELPFAPNRNLSELLAYQPGIFVSSLSRNDANWGSNGGLGPKYNSFLLDGLPIDSFIDGMSLDPMALERVEIQSGPAAVMYSNYLGMDFAGNQTPLAGITNFILRERVDAPLTRLQASYGSWDTLVGQAYSQGRAGALHYFFGGTAEWSDYTDYGAPGSWLNMLDDPAYTKLRLYAKATVFLDGDDQAVSLFVDYTGHSGDVGRPNRDYRHEYGTVNAAYRNRISRAVDLRIMAGARTYDRRWGEDSYPDSLALREHDGVEQAVFPGDITVTWTQSHSGQLTFGADAQVATYRTYAEVDGVESTGNDATASALGVFAEERVTLGEVVLRGGLRWSRSEQSYDRLGGAAPGIDEASWSKGLWSAGVRWNLSPSAALFANAGSSFVAPTPKAVGGTLALGDLGVPGRHGQLPNPDLQPESGLGADLGLDLRPMATGRLEVRGFWNRIADVIVDNVVSQDPSQTRSVNAGEATSYGIEVAFDHAVSHTISWFANATYTDSEIVQPLDPGQSGAEIPFVPDWMANLGASFQLPHGVVISPYLRAVGTYYDSTALAGRRSFGEYFIPALRAQATIDAGAGAEVVLALDLNNLVDDRYEMPWQFQDPGFNFLFTVGVRLR
jgi:outer membrane receptor protein involved in Fe transport